AGAIRNAVHNSFEVNITAKLDRAIHACVVSKINGFVRGEVKKAGAQLLGNSEQGTTGLQQIFANAGSMFGEVADTVRDVIMAINGPRFVNTAESLVEDAITGIDWNAVAAQV